MITRQGYISPALVTLKYCVCTQNILILYIYQVIHQVAIPVNANLEKVENCEKGNLRLAKDTKPTILRKPNSPPMAFSMMKDLCPSELAVGKK